MTQVSLFTEGQDLPLFQSGNVADAVRVYREWLKANRKDVKGALNLASYSLTTEQEYKQFEEAIK